MGVIYAAVFFLGATNANTVQPVVAIERTVFYRERAAGMYSSLPYAFAQVSIQQLSLFHQLLHIITYLTILIYLYTKHLIFNITSKISLSLLTFLK